MSKRALGLAAVAATLAGLVVVAPAAYAAPPSNDSFANALPLTGTTVTATGTNAGATTEAGEPQATDVSATVWWRWVAPSATRVEVSLTGSSFDTVLGVYTGTSVGSLSTVATNDDAFEHQSAVAFTPVAGRTYYLQVGGYDETETGSIALSISPLHVELQGTVTNQSHAGLRDVCVTVLDEVGDEMAGARTNASGVYEFDFLPAAAYSLRFDDCAGEGYQTEFYADAALFEDATQIAVAADGPPAVGDAELAAEPAPGQPTDLTATAGDGYVSLSWSWPNDGSTVRSGLIRYSTDGGATWAPDMVEVPTGATVYMVPDLANGTSYVFEVAGVNNGGAGDYSASSAPVTPDPAAQPATAPTAPGLADASGVKRGVTVAWNPPALNGGRALSGYVVQYSSDGGAHWTDVSVASPTATSYTLGGLQYGTVYRVRVAARNAVGVGAFSVDRLASPVADRPGQPTGLAGVALHGAVALHWTAPGDDGGAPVSAYEIRYSRDGGHSWASVTTGSAGTSYRMSGLASGTSYVFQVAARNSVGLGAYSATSPQLGPVSSGTIDPPHAHPVVIPAPRVLGHPKVGSKLRAVIALPSGVRATCQWVLTQPHHGKQKPKPKTVGHSASLKIKKTWKDGRIKLVVSYSGPRVASATKTVKVKGKIK